MLKTLLSKYFLTKYRSFTSRDQLEQWQNRRVLCHIKWVTAHSPFYAKIYKGLDINDWQNFPIISKQEMMDNFESLNTCGIGLKEAFQVATNAEGNSQNNSQIGKITVGLSSGTSGTKGLFLVNPRERFSWAGALLAKMLPQGLLHRHKIAFFFRTTSPLYNSLKSKIIQFEYYDLQKPLDEHISLLNLQQPSILVAPPSMLLKLAREYKRGNLKITPQKVISIAEILDPTDESYIQEAFNQKVHQIYQATEGFLATTCSHGTLHLNEDLLVIQKQEIPGDGSRFYPIITDFNRYSQPILRYKLNDILHKCDKACPCGSVNTAIKCIEGRSDDIFYFESDAGLKSIFPDFIRRAVITAHPSITEYLAIQINPTSIQFFIESTLKDTKEVYESVRQKVIALCKVRETKIPILAFYPYEHPSTTKKLRRIERRFQVDDTYV